MFKDSLPPEINEKSKIGFKLNGTPVTRWYLPLGVLCDELFGSEVPSPLVLTVHFEQPPQKEAPLVARQREVWVADEGALQGEVLMGFKESVVLQHGEIKPWWRLEMNSQKRLWSAIVECNLAECMEVVQKNNLDAKCEALKLIPIRVHLSGRVSESSAAEPRSPLLSPMRPVRVGPDGAVAATTVRCLLQDALPPVLANNGLAEDGKTLNPAAELVTGAEVLVQGLNIPLETPLTYLWLHARSLDNFVHLVVFLQPEGLL